LGTLHSLRDLDLSWNKLKEIPDSVYNLRNLKTLYISNNPADLQQMNSKFLQLTLLKNIQLFNCAQIETPPQRVCEKGVKLQSDSFF